MDELQKKLAHCEERGGLTPSDLARWANVGITTMRNWIVYGRVPRSYRVKEVHRLIDILVGLVNSVPEGQPLIPYNIKQRDRLPYLDRLRDEHTRISREDSAA